MNRSGAQALVRSHLEALRRALDTLTVLVSRVLAGERQRVAELLYRAQRVHEELSAHTIVEDRVLAPMLPPAEADRLRQHQVRRKRLLDALSVTREVDAELSELARRIGVLVHVLREEMVQEECSLSSARLLAYPSPRHGRPVTVTPAPGGDR